MMLLMKDNDTRFHCGCCQRKTNIRHSLYKKPRMVL